MKIRWLIEEREIPGIGLINLNDIKELPEQTAENLIKQGLAEEVIEEKNFDDEEEIKNGLWHKIPSRN